MKKEDKLDIKDILLALKETREILDSRFQETADRFKETDIKFQETARDIKELSRNIGGLNNSIGSMSEGLIYASIEKELYNHFGVDVVAPNIKGKFGNNFLELDAFGYSNGSKNEAYIVEIKTNLREDAILQLTKTMNLFPDFFKEHKHKKRYGIIAAINVPHKLKQKVYEAGFILATVENNIFKLDLPKGFKPKVWK